MIEAGVDLWYPQNMNDVRKLRDTYSPQLRFGVPLTVKDDSEEEAWRAVEKFIDEYGDNPNVVARRDWNTPAPHPKLLDFLYCASREKYSL